MLTLQLDLRDVERMFADIKGLVPKAARLAINETAKTTRTKAGEDIMARWAIGRNKLYRHLHVDRATNQRLQARVWSTNQPVPVYDFNRPSKVRAGVSVSILKGQRTTLKGAFIAKMGTGHTGVFVRQARSRKQGTPYKQLPVRTVKTGTWAGTTYRPALKITERAVPGVSSMWQKYIDKNARDAAQFLDAEMSRQLNRLLKAPRASGPSATP